MVSLSTRRYREAEHRAALLDRVFDGALARARQAVTEAGDKADLNTILRDYLRQVLEGDQAGSLPLTFMALPTLQHRLAKLDVG